MTAPDPRARFAADASPAAAASFAEMILEFLGNSGAGVGPVSPSLSPEVVAERFNEPLPLDGASLAAVLDRVRRDILADSNHLSHPMYLGHQVSAPLPTGIWADALISSINNSIAVNEMSPTLSHVERRVVRWMCDLVGWDALSGGTFTSGGTEASFTALLAARARVLPDAWEQGVGADPPSCCAVSTPTMPYRERRVNWESGCATSSRCLTRTTACPRAGWRSSWGHCAATGVACSR